MASDPTCVDCATCVPWRIDSGCCDDWEDLDSDLAVRSIDLAWATLRNLTGGRVGNCPVTVLPCPSSPCDVCVWPPQPRLVGGEWLNFVCGSPGCSCEPLCEIVLDSEIAMVQSIVADGLVVDPASYQVHNGNRIVRVDGGCWPSCQSETFAITFVPGIVPGPAGLWAAGVLACEYSKACTGGKCRLPSSVTTLARQGVVMAFTEGLFPGGVTGIREVDTYISALNPRHHSAPPKVWSPDVPWVHHRYIPPPTLDEINLAWNEGQPLVRSLTVSDVVPLGWVGVYTGPIKANGVTYGEFDVAEQVNGDDLQLTLTLTAAVSAGIPAGNYTFELIQDGTTVRLRGTAAVGAPVTAKVAV